MWPKYDHFIAKRWSLKGFFLNISQCAKGCSMPNFTLLAKSCSPLSKNGHNVALSWPKHGRYIVLQFRSSWILIIVPRDVPCQFSLCCLDPVAPFPRNGQNMALLWLNMVLTWSIKSVLLKPKQCAKRCSMLNFTLPSVSCGPLS